MTQRIVNLRQLGDEQRQHAAELLRVGFAHMQNAYVAPGEAESEVGNFLENPIRRALAAVEDHRLLGWIGVIETHDYAWELHPLVVAPSHQRRGIGTSLVGAMEQTARAEGVLTLYVGTDDDFGGTNLFGRELFPDVVGKIAGIAVTKGHPLAFYRRLGYEVVGLIPDASGIGKPDIFMAKQIGRSERHL
jgi:aminoglycoside 6'-N-acetyltransferase I